ncbi:PASTA domain-containing protein [Thalassovita mangrovi]|uniref:PASTA domain-containing protein n=1 Tax=Thalassovita mangrovi TaxID=2692236 RepID=A0A6L8LUE9_9RHOB|nr:PASTA domain-containing protein [Thalassovita mangrovi]MYM56952.1 PASTA domain-containing protein [Thalassovita mangrovi]
MSLITKASALACLILTVLSTPPSMAEPYVASKWVSEIRAAQPTILDGPLGNVKGGKIAPHKILEILPVKENNEFCKDAGPIWAERYDCKYTYKIILQRPKNDIANGSRGELPVLQPLTGVPWEGYTYRLEYLVAFKRRNELRTDLTVKKVPYPGDKSKLILLINEGLDPGRYTISVALYPNRVTLDDLSVNSDSLLKRFLQLFNMGSPIPDEKDVVEEMLLESQKIELFKLASTAKLVVPGRMPSIVGLTIEDADKELEARGLQPKPRPGEPEKASQIGRVIKQGKAEGRYLPPATPVDYIYGQVMSSGDSRGASDIGPADCCIGGFDGTSQCLENMKKNNPELYERCQELFYQ